ncbi:MAG: serine hydrolase, partial [Oscillospiraceae bacterium]|nr:serine hydrolase [Oscillospiraceae bacterium]
MNLSTASRTFQMFSRIFDTKSSTEPFLPSSGEKTSLPLRPPQQLFPRSTPESQGISSDHIRCFLEELGHGSDLYMQNALILRRGKLLCGAAYGAQRLEAAKYTFSACKSVTSLAIGLLIDDGILHLNDTVAEIFDAPSHIHRRLKNLTVEDLLTMRSGIPFSEAQTTTESDWLQGIFNESLNTEPGTTFHYNSLNTYLLAAIVQKICGMGLCEFLEKRLFSPMG